MSPLHPANADKILVRSAWLSFWLSLLVLAIKFYGYYVTHSQSVLSDAIESVVNVLSSLIALFVMKAVAAPADEDHPYGHGKLEFFSSAFEGGLIGFAALAIIYSAIVSFWTGQAIESLELGLLTMGIASGINFLLSLHLHTVSRKYQSEALLASAKHVMSDVVTTIGVFAGLLLVRLSGWQWLDGAIAVAVSILLLYQGIRIVRKSAGALIDETDLSALQSLAAVFEKNRIPGFIDIYNVKVIRSGRFHHIDGNLLVPEYWTVEEAHAETQKFEKSVLQEYAYDGEIAFRLDPCLRSYCRTCAVANCPVRQQAFEKARPLLPTELTGPVKPDARFVGER